MADPAKHHAERLSWELESWKSIEFQIHDTFENKARRDASEFSAARSEDHYIETAIGQRLFEERIFPVGEQASVTINYCDGNRCANETVREFNGGPFRQIIIKRPFSYEADGQTHRPEPLKAFYVGLEPLSKALPRATYLGTNRYIGRDCDLFLFPKAKNGQPRFDTVYWLDQATSVPLRREMFAHEKARARDQPLAAYRAESLDEVEGRHFSLKYQVISFMEKGLDPQTVRYLTEGVVESVRFDREYPKSTFWPVITQEASVYDTIKKTHIRGVRPGEAQTKATGAPIRANDSTSPATLISLALLIVGLMVLGAGIVFWFRGRKRAAG